jgi:hypothetical protein
MNLPSRFPLRPTLYYSTPFLEVDRKPCDEPFRYEFAAPLGT